MSQTKTSKKDDRGPLPRTPRVRIKCSTCDHEAVPDSITCQRHTPPEVTQKEIDAAKARVTEKGW